MSVGGRSGSDPVAAQVDAVLDVLRGTLAADVLVAVCLYGSAVVGGLRPDSDLDLFAVVTRPLHATERRLLVDGLVPISWRRRRPAGWRPVELTLVVHAEVRPWRYPPRHEFQYGEWLRDELVLGDVVPSPSPDPDLAVLLTMVRETGRPLVGPPPASLLDAVPRDDLVRAMRESTPALLDDLETDTRNVLLTLARIWSTMETGTIRPKDAAAAWAGARLPPADRRLLGTARSGYLGEAEDRWDDPAAVRTLATALVDRIEMHDTTAAAPLPPRPPSV